MFTPSTVHCRVDRSNLALFYPDRITYTIDANCIAGWYVLYPPYVSASAELIYVPTGGGNYLGFTTQPMTTANRPIESSDITTGKCEIAWASVEDGFNNPYRVEDTSAQAQEIMYLTGRASNEVGSDRQVFGLYLQSGWFNRSTAGLSNYLHAIKIIARVRHSPSDVLFKLNNVFGYQINLICREISSYQPMPQYLSALSNGADIGSYEPKFLSLMSANGVLAVVLTDPTPTPVTLKLHLGATRFDTFTSSLPIDQCSIDSVDIHLPLNTTNFTISTKLPTEGRYSPVLHKSAIPGWL